MSKKIAFVDRDGTINVDFGYIKKIHDFCFTDGAPEAIKLLRRMGFAVAVITNQSAVGLGLCTVEEISAVHRFLCDRLADIGTKIDAIAFCPHAIEDNCSCRKPKIGLAKMIADQLRVKLDYSASWTIGDKPSDVAFGQRLGTQTALIRSRNWDPESLRYNPTLIGDSLWKIVQQIGSASQT